MALIRVLPNEVHLFVSAGQPMVLTRSKAIDLQRELTMALKLPEPYLPRLSPWRRLVDWWRYRPTARRLAEDARRKADVQRMMGSGPVRRIVGGP